MEDLSLHVLDVVENSIDAGATRVEISICEDRRNDLMRIRIADNGRGMDAATLRKATDPFFTTRRVRRVGLGLSLFEQAARAAGGSLKIESQPGAGTAITASFQHSHIDRKPLGNMAKTLLALILTHPEIELAYTHQDDGAKVSLDTREISSRLGSVAMSSPEAISAVRKSLEKVGDRARRKAPRKEA